MVVDSLIKVMDVSPEDYKDYDFCRNIRDMAREFERIIGKKLDEAVLFFLHKALTVSDTRDQ